MLPKNEREKSKHNYAGNFSRQLLFDHMNKKANMPLGAERFWGKVGANLN